MSQPSITYTLTWGANNVYQKLSGQTYTDPNGKVVDCNTLVVNIVAPEDFVKFYATAVKDGKDYGFIDDVLVDIEGENPTGIKIHELNLRNAGTYSFTINATNHLIDGGGLYRIGLYIQQEDGTWNYEYFFVPVGYDYFDLQNLGDHLMVPVVTDPGEAYAVFDSSINTLTFFRDKKNKYSQRQTDGTKIYYTGIEDIEGSDILALPWYSEQLNIQNVIFQDIIKPKSTAWWFYRTSISEITSLEKLDTSKVTTMASMFSNCTALTAININTFNTSNVIDMSGMFLQCMNLINLDAYDIDMSKVNNTEGMFTLCRLIHTTLNIKKMPDSYNGMFASAALSSLNGEIILKYTSPVTDANISTLISTAPSTSNIINGGPA